MNDFRTSSAPSANTAPSPVDVVSSRAETPVVHFIGAGGFGINLARILDKRLGARSTEKPLVTFLDSSDANVRDDDRISVKIVADGNGAGKIRSRHSDEIRKNLPQANIPDADVYVVMFGLSGGSGSVIGPLTARELARRGKRVVAIVTADTLSEIDAKNTLNTLQTLEAIVSRNDIYLPVILANNADLGRNEVDRYVLDQATNLFHLITQPTSEVDKNDRLTFLDPSLTNMVDKGMRMIYVEDNTSDIQISELRDDSVIADSVLSLGHVNSDGTSTFMVNVGRRARWRKEGILSSTTTVGPIIGVILNSADRITQLMKLISDTTALFASQSKKTASAVKFDSDSVGEDDLIL